METQALKSGGYTGGVERLAVFRSRKFRAVPKSEPGKQQLFQMAKHSPLSAITVILPFPTETKLHRFSVKHTNLLCLYSIQNAFQLKG